MKSESTARAYKGYVAQAIVMLTEDSSYELSTDVKSAINALHRFQQAMKVSEFEAPSIEDDDLNED